MSFDGREGPRVPSAEVEAFETIFTRYYPLVYRLAYRYMGQPDEAEDIAQEVFMRFYHLPPRAANEAQQRSWLCKVAINISLNALRRRKSSFGHEQLVPCAPTIVHVQYSPAALDLPLQAASDGALPLFLCIKW
jgi:RNA polymerase sigma-70 factor (ECF subfamily)